MTLLKFFSGLLFPLLLAFLASVLAYYFQPFVNYSIPFVLVVPLVFGVKYKKKNHAFFYGTISGVLITLILIVIAFQQIIKFQNSMN